MASEKTGHHDAAFEEGASLNAEKVRATAVQFRKGRARLSAKRTTPFRLAATGPVETAILWKNWLLFGRTSRAWIVSAGLGLLLVESYAATEILGRILDRTDLQDVVVQ